MYVIPCNTAEYRNKSSSKHIMEKQYTLLKSVNSNVKPVNKAHTSLKYT